MKGQGMNEMHINVFFLHPIVCFSSVNFLDSGPRMPTEEVILEEAENIGTANMYNII